MSPPAAGASTPSRSLFRLIRPTFSLSAAVPLTALKKSLRSGSDENRVMERVEQHDLVKYGLIPELIGRIPVIAVLENLDKPALIRIMTEPKNSIVKQYTRMFQMDGVQLEFQPEALAAMADVTLERKTGARGLRSVFEATLKELMFQIPSDSTVEKVTITPETVRSGAEPIILRNPKKESHDLTAGALKNA